MERDHPAEPAMHPDTEICDGRRLAPAYTIVRPSIAASLAGVSVNTVYSWIKRDILVDCRGPNRVTGMRLDNLASVTGQSYTWLDLAMAAAAASEFYEKLEAGRRKRRPE
jgi:hypothetical protein